MDNQQLSVSSRCSNYLPALDMFVMTFAPPAQGVRPSAPQQQQLRPSVHRDARLSEADHLIAREQATGDPSRYGRSTETSAAKCSPTMLLGRQVAELDFS
jgi:hypothetical protein